MAALYNEIEPYAAEWLVNLVAAGHIAPGKVDTRSIVELSADDVRDATQAHFFAGLGGWSHALRLAGWPDDATVWTGSCPCQPFSAAGKRKGFDDDRHLWPVWFNLIRECAPAVVFGEQVASADGLEWLDTVSADLEKAGYAFAAADLCAAGAGAPHIRQRLFFVAVAAGVRLGHADRERTGRDGGAGARSEGESGGCRVDDWDVSHEPDSSGLGVGHADRPRSQGRWGFARDEQNQRTPGAASQDDGFWSGAEWLECSDGKARPTQPGLHPLAHGVPARVGRLRAYGNAIVPQVAATFIRSVMEVM